MKKLFDFVPTHLLVFFVLGILCQYHFEGFFSINFLFVSVVLLGGFFFFFKRFVLGIGIGAVAGVAVVVAVAAVAGVDETGAMVVVD